MKLFLFFFSEQGMKLSISYRMTLTRSFGNESLALGNQIQSVQKWLRAENGFESQSNRIPAFNYIILRGLYRITFEFCDMGKIILNIIFHEYCTEELVLKLKQFFQHFVCGSLWVNNY